MFAILYLLVLAASNMVVKSEDQGTEECTPFRLQSSDLTYQNLTKVPSGLPQDTRYLDLSHNNVSRLEKGNLAGLPDLCFLKFTHNGLQHVSPLAFTNNTRLKVLNISHNSLLTIPVLLLPQLTVLDVSVNHYDSYTLGKSFENLKFLRNLLLGSPNAFVVKLNDFEPLRNNSLKSLTLGVGSKLQQYEAGSLSQLKSLQTITLKMPFCQQFEMFKTILMDLRQTQTKEIILVKFLTHFCNVSSDPFDTLGNMSLLRSLTFVDTWINSSVGTKMLKNVFLSRIEEFALVNITYNEDTPDGLYFQGIPGHNGTMSVKSIIVDGVLHYQYRYPTFNVNVSYFRHLTYMKFSHTGMNISPCNMIPASQSLKRLDLSNNLLTDSGFWWFGCSYTKVLPAMQWLSLSHNQFSSLPFIAEKTHQMKLLEYLDLSYNSIMLTGKDCVWPTHLTELSLSNNNLGNTVFQCLSPHFQRIHLSKIGITAITSDALTGLPNLTHLFLSFNSILTLPDDFQAPILQALHVDNNGITSIGQSLLQGLPSLKILKAGGNPFSCSCDAYWFLTAFNKSLLPDWPLDYTCSNPPSFKGTPLKEYKPAVLACKPLLLATTVVSVVVVIAVVFGLTFYACDGVWYTKMLWVWIRVKRRGYQEANRLQEASFRFHAFISYSHEDSLWVETQLVPSLEGAGLTLCLHERDFVPGEWIVDNIINSVEQSYKTLFVLSNSFVQSNWCIYELFFAQHRAFGVRQDSLVFVLLEPIPVDSIPRKFLKLRSMLQQQTYLEWPQTERKEQVFWASLKALLRTADKNVVVNAGAVDVSETSPLLGPEVYGNEVHELHYNT